VISIDQGGLSDPHSTQFKENGASQAKNDPADKRDQMRRRAPPQNGKEKDERHNDGYENASLKTVGHYEGPNAEQKSQPYADRFVWNAHADKRILSLTLVVYGCVCDVSISDCEILIGAGSLP
jgi:hypothetical protein